MPIAAASRSLWIQNPKFVDAVILERIQSARDRGVQVRVLCGGEHGICDWDVCDTFSSLRIMERFGVKIRRQKHLQLHARLIVVDGTFAQSGSIHSELFMGMLQVAPLFVWRRSFGLEPAHWGGAEAVAYALLMPASFCRDMWCRSWCVG